MSIAQSLANTSSQPNQPAANKSRLDRLLFWIAITFDPEGVAWNWGGFTPAFLSYSEALRATGRPLKTSTPAAGSAGDHAAHEETLEEGAGVARGVTSDASSADVLSRAA
ncbi:MAG: hypothetical protein ACO3Z6_10815 [Pseudomonadales bacterium]